MVAVRSLLLAAGAAAAASTTVTGSYPQIPIFDAVSYATVVNRTANGELQLVSVPASAGGGAGAGDDLQTLRVMHVYGTPAEMGRAHGQLLGPFAAEFLTTKMAQYFEARACCWFWLGGRCWRCVWWACLYFRLRVVPQPAAHFPLTVLSEGSTHPRSYEI